MSDGADIVLAKHLSVSACKHGNVFVRLHAADGRIFAAGIMNARNAIAFAGAVTDAVEEVFAEAAPGDCLESMQ